MHPTDPLRTDGEVPLATVTVTDAVCEVSPAVSRTRAVSVCPPLAAVAVFQLTVYGELVSSASRSTPSSWNRTPATATLSVAVAVTCTVPDTVAPVRGDEIAPEGGVVSGAVVVPQQS